MCGRFTLSSSSERLATLFDVDPLELAPRYNVAPSQPIAVVRARPPARDGAEVRAGPPARGGAAPPRAAPEAAPRELALLRWGLVPSWSKDPKQGVRLINARAESAADKPAFRAAMRARRCLVPADGFYEWDRSRAPRQPYLIGRRDGAPLAMAGLWERWQGDDGAAVESVALLTTAANALVARIHDRMPVILEPAAWSAWLDPGQRDPSALAPLLVPCPAETLALVAVSRRVNSPRNDDPDCVRPVDLSPA